MKKKDILFLAYLRKDARETLTTISRKTSVPISSLYDKLRSLEKDIITKHTTIIDFSKLGYLCRANIILKVEIEDRDLAKNYLLCNENVNSLFKINNGYDFMVEGVFKHIKEMEDFLELFERKFKVLNKNVYYVIEDLKRESFLGEPELININAD